jgi:NitT/TauT family transport system permease protein
MRKYLPILLPPVAVGGALLGLWYLACVVFFADRQFLLPPPEAVVQAFVSEAPTLWQATLNTAAGAALGFFAAVVISFGLAVLLAFSPWVRAGLYPYLMMLQMTPIIVFAPILVLWVGAGLASVSIITFLICFFPLVVNTTQGLISVDQNLVDLFRLYRASKTAEIWRLRMPACLPYFFTGLRIAATLAPIAAIVGDYSAGNAADGVGGLGFQIIVHSARFEIAASFATALCGCALGFLFVAAVIGLNWLALHQWHDSFRREEEN